ncbi:hypothetical protein EH223_05605 [candidate division KSB1 bacterium]|nr:hypothetical protein [candidate division KSB1 bacterium]RQW05237.1 MAG: hypothetical protein EH223_05605 [candidate division KSB1 bacterium]
MGDKRAEQPKDRVDFTTRPDVSFSDEISTTTLVKLLVRKGILTSNEILNEERQTRLRHDIVKDKIHNHLSFKKRKQSRFKRWAAKHRWSRRLTYRLFGWEWKKSKHSHSSNSEERD